MGKDLTGTEIGQGICQRKSGTYMARYVDQYQKRHTLYDRDLKKLKRKLEKAKYESEYGLLGNASAVTLERWFEEFLTLYKIGKVKETTVYRIRQTFSPCRRNAIGNMKLTEIRAIHVQNLINTLSDEGFTYGTLNLLKGLLKELFKTAIGNGLMVINPCDAVVLPKREKYESRFLTEDEQAMFLSVARDYCHYDIFCLSLVCGARIGEILGLKWEDVDFDAKTMHIQRTLHYAKVNDKEKCHFFFTTPKTKTSDRKIPMLPEMEAILRRVQKEQLGNKRLYKNKWCQEEPFEGMVFTTKQGAPIRYGDVNRTIKTCVSKANLIEEELAKIEKREPFVLEMFSPHCFRHTFITRCKANNVPYEIICPYVGHSTKEMTMYYNHHKEELDATMLKGIKFGVV